MPTRVVHDIQPIQIRPHRRVHVSHAPFSFPRPFAASRAVQGRSPRHYPVGSPAGSRAAAPLLLSPASSLRSSLLPYYAPYQRPISYLLLPWILRCYPLHTQGLRRSPRIASRLCSLHLRVRRSHAPSRLRLMHRFGPRLSVYSRRPGVFPTGLDAGAAASWRSRPIAQVSPSRSSCAPRPDIRSQPGPFRRRLRTRWRLRCRLPLGVSSC